MYSKLIHTVDHVEGLLAPDRDGIDAFIAHMWAVTITGAPKLAAMQFIEDHEKSPRSWYGGAIGKLGFDGNINTGLTLRTMRIVEGQAQVRAGATLLYDSDPDAEANETALKASALLEALRPDPAQASSIDWSPKSGAGKTVLFIDHNDSFVHTLANYVRQTGASVHTLRAGFSRERFEALAADCVLMSPGPGRPQDFDCHRTLAWSEQRRLPVFGVCLGLQAMVEYFGGALATLGYPVHGKASKVQHDGQGIFAGLPPTFEAGRYHSLIADRARFPAPLRVTATCPDDDTIMGIVHRERPWAAVQFHPESILSDHHKLGLRLLDRALSELCGGPWT